MDIVWEDPPASPQGRPGFDWIGLLLPLMERPNVWARIREVPRASQAYNTTVDLRQGKRRVPAGRWEFRSATVEGKHYVYARYLGGDDAKH